jgi:XTP/dITP diphosphohydrolase
MTSSSLLHLVLATGNAHKAAEIADGLAVRGLPVRLETASAYASMADCVEDGETFRANAHRKADFLRPFVPADAWVLADDSGLEVDALGGAPGVRSARFAGEEASDADNRALLLERLRGCMDPAARTARFRCHFALLLPDHHGASGHDSTGAVEGHLLSAERGAGGFGYDSLFVPAGESLTFAEMEPSRKDRLSHRGKALDALAAWLRETA